MFSAKRLPEVGQARPWGRVLPCWTWPSGDRIVLVLGLTWSALAIQILVDLQGRDTARVFPRAPRLVVDPNTAPAPVLEALPELGPGLVGRIVAERAVRPFQSAEDFHRRVRGIGPVTLARIRPFLRFADTATDALVQEDADAAAVVAEAPWPAWSSRSPSGPAPREPIQTASKSLSVAPDR